MKNRLEKLLLAFLASLIICTAGFELPSYADSFAVPAYATSRTQTEASEKDVSFDTSTVFITGDYLVYGFAMRHSDGICREAGGEVHIEADYGITMTAGNKTLYVSGYDHTDEKFSISSVTVIGRSPKNKSVKKTLNVSVGKRTRIYTSTYKTGLYEIKAKFAGGKTVKSYFYVNTDGVCPCIAEDASSSGEYKRNALAGCLRTLKSAMKKASASDFGGGFAIDGSKSLALDKFYYPCYSFGIFKRFRCDTKKWVSLSNKLVDKSMSDEYKAYVIFMWIIDNIAYDEWQCADGKGSRTLRAEDWSGRYSVWELKCGVCFDFANIFAIMCRAQGIPCTTIGSDELNHMWNVVMINGRWIEVDLSSCAKYTVYKEDVTKRELSRDSMSSVRKYFFGMFPNTRESAVRDVVINDQLLYGDPSDKSSMTYYVW